MSAHITPASPLFGLETPYPFQPTQNYFQLIGWTFLPGSREANRVRVAIGEQIFEPLERIARPDVATSFPQEPAALHSGFKFICYLPFGFYTGALEVSADGRHWHRARTLAIPVGAHPILGAVENPPAHAPVTEPVRIEGWCFHPEFEVRQIVMQFGNVEVPCDYGLARPDVAMRFPNNPAAAHSGFITTENLPRGVGGLKLRAHTACGRLYFIRSEHRVDITRGGFPKPPPPSPVRDLSTVRWTRNHQHAAPATRERGARNILFALYGDFSANSALHVANLANELIALGYDCVVAVPAHKETVGALPRADFMAIEFAELPHLPSLFKDQRGPGIVHAWTSRENVRKFSEAVVTTFGSKLFVHLEDNEQDILVTRLERSFEQIAAMPDEDLDPLVEELSHPRRAPAFLRTARGITVIVDRLREQAPSEVPIHLVWPAPAAGDFSPRDRDDRLRTALGIAPSDVVLFYHGNTHTSNAGEVRSLYDAVALLNRRGLKTFLIRTGRDFPEFAAYQSSTQLPGLIHLGHVARAKHLPALMALADVFVQPGLPDAFNNYRFPSKLPEFFSIGRPVILPETNLGSLVRHGIDAWVLPRADAESIANAITQLHRQPELSARLAQGAREFASRHFSWKRSAAELVDFYCSLTDLPLASSS